ncbi:nuclear transport factor 2 family protein [Nonlabens sp.]|uniref:nuclear transport factor 2 family protein n=1 Tax=Nonlabens sp. TaxID=1888209 RepID=UPI0032660BBC
MRKIFTAIIIAIFISSCVQIKTNDTSISSSQDVEEVEVLIQNIFDDIWSDHKAEVISKYHTDDFLLLEHGEVWNNDTIANWCKMAAMRDNGSKRINNFERISAKQDGNKIWLAYHNYATITKDSMERNLSWLESVVAVKKDSIWQLELMHSTRNTKN